MSEYLSAEYTRVEVSRLFPRVGEVFVTNRRRPILAFVEDASPGIHDMLAPACDQTRYAALGVPGWHASCDENLRTAMRELGHEIVVVPQSINVFMNVRVGASGSLSWQPAPTSAGDSVTLRAELDCIVAVSACPQDIAPTNDGRPTPVAVELLVRPGPG